MPPITRKNGAPQLTTKSKEEGCLCTTIAQIVRRLRGILSFQLLGLVRISGFGLLSAFGFRISGSASLSAA
jgi:hypothetical protein